MTDEEMMTAKRLEKAIEDKYRNTPMGKTSLLSLDPEQAYLLYRAVTYYISRHEKLRTDQ